MNNKRRDDYRVVYSTDVGTMCKSCGAPVNKCICHEKKNSVVRGDGNVRVRRETKGRGGKTVTSVTGIAMNEANLSELVGQLKKICGCGGTVKEGVIEIQGDHSDLLLKELEKRGIRGKKSGG